MFSFCKKAKALFLLYFVACSALLGQQSLVIEGTVTDVNSLKVIPNATVTLRTNDTTVNIITNENGYYKFASPLIKPDKIYVLFAHSDSPVYGNSGSNEAYASTYGLNNNPRLYVRNIKLSGGVNSAEPASPCTKVHFAFKQNSIANPRDSVMLDWLTFLKKNPTYVVEIEGYADRKEGNKEFRLLLSRARAKEIINSLRDNGIQLERIRLMGNGANNPVMDARSIRKTKGKDAKMAARLLNCRAEMVVKNIFFPPPSTIVLNGMVTDINTGIAVVGAFVQLSGSDGSKVTAITDSTGHFNTEVKNFNPVTFYDVIAVANGYNSSEQQDDVLKITPEGKDKPEYSHNFRIEKNGYKKPYIFPPVLFDSGSVVLNQTAKDSLKEIGKLMKRDSGIIVEFMGDADRHENSFIELASKRAHMCVNYMISLGLDSARFLSTSRVTEQEEESLDKNTTSIVKHKENQRHFNSKRCNVSFWVVQWDYKKQGASSLQ